MLLISNIIIAIGVFFIILGIIGILKSKDFYTRILVASNIDTVGMATIIIGLMLRSGFTAITFKLLIVLLIFIITTPVITHTIAFCAYDSGYILRKGK